MRIGELSKLSGLSASRIRFYESLGLIKTVRRTQNGYRDYTRETLRDLQIITSAQDAGFSLEQIQRLMPAGPATWHHTELLQELKQKVTELEQLKIRLSENVDKLNAVIESIERAPSGLECRDREVWVFDELRKAGVVSMWNTPHGTPPHSED